MTSWYVFVILLSMKIAISLPSALCEKAAKTASYMGITQSKLFTLALEEFLQNNNGQMITEKINAVYEKIKQKETDPYLEIVLEPTRTSTENETW